jgi:hypothetical protein
MQRLQWPSEQTQTNVHHEKIFWCTLTIGNVSGNVTDSFYFKFTC